MYVAQGYIDVSNTQCISAYFETPTNKNNLKSKIRFSIFYFFF